MISKLLVVVLMIPGLLLAEEGWVTLFDGSSLEGWRSNEEQPDVFTITETGELKVFGGRAHLFWEGNETVPTEIQNFEFKAKVKTTPQSNGGIFFHTQFQESGWPEYGLEAQINTTHKDRRKTASIYAIQDVLDDAPSTDGEWFDYLIRVQGKTVTVEINGKVVNEYTEPTPVVTPEKRPNTRLGKGTFALQGHDPKSTTYFKDIRVRLLD
ncbi:MAG: DUF1080 domain-containing protein [Verrucomicrobiota bacterium]